MSHLCVLHALLDAFVALEEALLVHNQLLLAPGEQSFIGANEIFEQLRRHVDVVACLLLVAERLDFAIQVHLDLAEDHLLQVFNAQHLLGLSRLVVARQLLPREVLLGHVLETGTIPVAKLDHSRRIDKVGRVAHILQQDIRPR